MTRINDYSIMAITKSNKVYFVDGYKSLATMRKHFFLMSERLKNVPHDSIMLVARDYDRNIIKVYDKFD